MSRHSVNKSKSTRSFNRQNERTHSFNVRTPMRGGWRL